MAINEDPGGEYWSYQFSDMGWITHFVLRRDQFRSATLEEERCLVIELKGVTLDIYTPSEGHRLTRCRRRYYVIPAASRASSRVPNHLTRITLPSRSDQTPKCVRSTSMPLSRPLPREVTTEITSSFAVTSSWQWSSISSQSS